MLLSARGKVKGGIGTGGGEGNRSTVMAGSDKERGRGAGRRVAVVDIVFEPFMYRKLTREEGEYVGLLTSVAAQVKKSARKLRGDRMPNKETKPVEETICLLALELNDDRASCR